MNDKQNNIINPNKRWFMRQYKIKVKKSLTLANRSNHVNSLRNFELDLLSFLSRTSQSQGG